MREGALRMSETGPGKPYWKRPAGSTGGGMGNEPSLGSPNGMGTGAGGAVREGVEAVVVVVVVVMVSFRLPRP